MPATAFADLQWGDGGKGKIISYFSKFCDLGVRGQGGGNSGHVSNVEGNEIVFHIVPSCAIDGRKAAIGRGCVVYPKGLVKEVNDLNSAGLDVDLMIDERAHVTTEKHILEDSKDKKIGTTGKGIGQTYTSKVAREGIRMVDYIRDSTEPEADILRPLIGDVALKVNEYLDDGKEVQLEGAQGFGLCVDNGTYPYITSSNTTFTGLCAGVGISERRLDRAIGIVKAFPTRVGNGPMPTILGGKRTEEYCDDKTHGKQFELQTYGIPFSVIKEGVNEKITYNHRDPEILRMMNSQDEFTKGIGFRLAGNEYGATTKRPRKPGWFDAVLIRTASMVNHPDEIALTKLDVLSGLKELKICNGYETESGRTLSYLPADTKIMWSCKPVYETLPGWKEDIRGVRRYDKLPRNARKYAEKIESVTRSPVTMIGTGSERSQLILRET